jgi:NADH-quinone oxidoreductase subunit A
MNASVPLAAAALICDVLMTLAVVVFLARAGRIFGPAPRHEGDAEIPYETGLPPLGAAGQGVGVLYWRFAVLFVVFDVDLAFLLPWALTRSNLDRAAVIAVSVFISLAVFMLAYLYRKGALSCR